MMPPEGFAPLPIGDLYFPEFTHSRARRVGASQGREYWRASRPDEVMRVVYLGHYARCETTHKIERAAVTGG